LEDNKIKVQKIKENFEEILGRCEDAKEVEYVDFLIRCILNVEKNKREDELNVKT